MERRALLVGAGLVVAGTAVKTANAAQDHSQHGGGAYPKLAAAAAECVKKGQVCIGHCLELLGQGDKSLAACAQSATQMTAVCGAMQLLAAQNSKHLAKYAKVAMEVCQGCEAECRKHAAAHQACKDCADSCAACAKECQSA